MRLRHCRIIRNNKSIALISEFAVYGQCEPVMVDLSMGIYTTFDWCPLRTDITPDWFCQFAEKKISLLFIGSHTPINHSSILKFNIMYILQSLCTAFIDLFRKNENSGTHVLSLFFKLLL